MLVDGHEPADWAEALQSLLADRRRMERLRAGAVRHAAGFGWDATADRMLDVYSGARADLRTLIRDAIDFCT